jgi:hypothetical protein
MNGSRIYLADLALLLPGISIFAPKCVQADASQISTNVTNIERGNLRITGISSNSSAQFPNAKIVIDSPKGGSYNCLARNRLGTSSERAFLDLI